jgi:hypothetical protein
MLYIPARLMITPLSAFNDPVMGDLFKNTRDVLRGTISSLPSSALPLTNLEAIFS